MKNNLGIFSSRFSPETGMRVGEVTGLRWKDIDLNAGMIDVNHTLAYYKHRDENGCYFSIHSPKTRAGKRQIPMTEDVKNAFLLEKEMQELSGIHNNVTVDGYQNFIFINRFGGVQHQGSLNKALRRIIRDCNDKQLLKEKRIPCYFQISLATHSDIRLQHAW